MGAAGSGNRSQFGRRTTGAMLRLDVRKLARAGVLREGYRGSWQWSVDGKAIATIEIRAHAGRLILSYLSRGDGKEWSYPVGLDRTACNYGNWRPWFICPGAGCGRRVAILYGGAAVFACRKCHRLA